MERMMKRRAMDENNAQWWKYSRENEAEIRHVVKISFTIFCLYSFKVVKKGKHANLACSLLKILTTVAIL